jgi:MinD-like ATPase involved in chromosome partitioning or flagellar assembly
MKRIVVMGSVRPAILNSLATRFLVEVAHRLMPADPFAGDILRSGDYHAILIGHGVGQEAQAQIFQTINGRQPVPIVAVIGQQSFHSNWALLTGSAGGEQAAAALRLEARKNPAAVLLVLSTKGGVGKSNISANVAIALARLGLRVAVADDDMTSRSLRTWMGISDVQYHTANLIADIHSQEGVITAELVSRYLLPAHGVSCLVGPRTLMAGLHVHEDIARNLLTIIGNDLGFDVVVIDAPPDFQNSSSFTYGILKYPESSPSQPITLVPTIPERYNFMAVEDTLSALTSARLPLERIFPVINCMKPKHDPEMLRGNKLLWTEPIGVIPYCEELQYVGESETPPLLQYPGGRLKQWWSRWYGRGSTLGDFQKAYLALAQNIAAKEQLAHE